MKKKPMKQVDQITQTTTSVGERIMIGVMMLGGIALAGGIVAGLFFAKPAVKTVIKPIVQEDVIIDQDEEYPEFTRVAYGESGLTAVLYNADEPDQLKTTRTAIENHGGRVALMLPGGVILAQIEASALPALQNEKTDIEILSGTDVLEKRSLDDYSEDTRISLGAFNKLTYDEQIVPVEPSELTEEMLFTGGRIDPETNFMSTDEGDDIFTFEDEMANLISEVTNDKSMSTSEQQRIVEDLERQTDRGTSSVPTGLGLRDTVMVIFNYVESAASGNQGDEDWVDNQAQEHWYAAVGGLFSLWKTAPAEMDLMFAIIAYWPNYSDNIINYEPATMDMGSRGTWMHALMVNFGFNGGGYLAEIDDYVDWNINTLWPAAEADQGFPMFVVKDQYNWCPSSSKSCWPHAMFHHYASVPWSFRNKWGIFGDVWGIEVDPGNNQVYVSDVGRSQIVQLDSGDGGTTYGDNRESIGEWGGNENEFKFPMGMDVDTATNKLYIADDRNFRLVRVDTEPFGDNWESYGSYGSGTGQFQGVSDVAIDTEAGKVYVMDMNYDSDNYCTFNRLVRFDINPLGANWETFGSYGSGTNQFKCSNGFTIDPSEGKVYVADYYNHRIVRFDMNTLGSNWETYGSQGSGQGQFERPTDIGVAGNKVYVLEYGNHRVTSFDRSPLGSNWEAYGSYGFGDNQFVTPESFVVDDVNNTLYIANDRHNHRVLKIDTDPLGANWEKLDYYDLWFEKLAGNLVHETLHVFETVDQYYANSPPMNVGCRADGAFAIGTIGSPIAHTRVLNAGEPDVDMTNANDRNSDCLDYQTSVMKSTYDFRWETRYFTYPPLDVSGAPGCCENRPALSIDWHARAQAGWGDTDVLSIQIDREGPSSEWSEKYANVYIDGEFMGVHHLISRNVRASVPVTEGAHILEILSEDGEIGLVDGPVYNFTIENTDGPDGAVTSHGITYIQVEVGNICHDGDIPYQCPAGLNCNESSGDCVECVDNSDCGDGNNCSSDTCNNPGELDSYCTYPDIPNECGGRECGWDSWRRCYQCGDNNGECLADQTCLSGYCDDDCGTTPAGECNGAGDDGLYCDDGSLVETDCRTCSCDGANCLQDSGTGNFSCSNCGLQGGRCQSWSGASPDCPTGPGEPGRELVVGPEYYCATGSCCIPSETPLDR